MSRDDQGNGWDPNQDVEPEASLLASIDPLAFAEAFVQAAIGMATHAGAGLGYGDDAVFHALPFGGPAVLPKLAKTRGFVPPRLPGVTFS